MYIYITSLTEGNACYPGIFHMVTVVDIVVICTVEQVILCTGTLHVIQCNRDNTRAKVCLIQYNNICRIG